MRRRRCGGGRAGSWAEGEAAFYGPKIDIQVSDHAGRESTLSTVQVDFYQPERFDLRYVGADGAKHRPVMVHRSIIGSVERAVAHLIEHHGGAFPAWMAPVQVAVLPVSAAEEPAAARLRDDCLSAGLRVRVLNADVGSLGARVRETRLVPYQFILGPAEVSRGDVAVRLRDGRRLPGRSSGDAVARVQALVRAHAARLWAD